MIGNFSRIVAYGCSYTAGDELLDAEILHKLGTSDEIDAIKRSYTNSRISDFRDKYYTSKYVDEKWLNHEGAFDWGEKIRQERKMSWAAQLAKIFDKEYINNGMGGASIEYCVYSYEEDLANGILRDDDLIVIGIPTPGRLFWLAGDGNPQRSLYNYPDSWGGSRDLYEVCSLHFLNTANLYWNYYKHLKYFDMVYKERGNVLAFYTNIQSSNIKGYYIDDITNHPVDKMVNSLANMKYIIPDIDFMHGKPDEVHGFGHNKIDKHIEIAHKLAAIIEKNRV